MLRFLYSSNPKGINKMSRSQYCDKKIDNTSTLKISPPTISRGGGDAGVPLSVGPDLIDKAST